MTSSQFLKWLSDSQRRPLVMGVLNITPDSFFKWQGSYGAMTIPEKSLSAVESYIMHQKDRHSRQTLEAEFEKTCEDTM